MRYSFTQNGRETTNKCGTMNPYYLSTGSDEGRDYPGRSSAIRAIKTPGDMRRSFTSKMGGGRQLTNCRTMIPFYLSTGLDEGRDYPGRSSAIRTIKTPGDMRRSFTSKMGAGGQLTNCRTMIPFHSSTGFDEGHGRSSAIRAIKTPGDMRHSFASKIGGGRQLTNYRIHDLILFKHWVG